MADSHFATLVSATAAANASANPIFVRLTDGTDASLIDGSGNLNVILAANSDVDIGDVDVTSVPAPLSTAGGGTEATALRVTIANDSTGLVSVDDGGSSLTVDGSVTVTASDLDIRDLSETTDHVLVFANTVKDGSGTDYVPLVDANGRLQVDVITGGGGGTEYSEDVAVPATIVGGANMFERDDALATLTPIEGDWAAQKCNARGALWVELDLTNDVTIADGGNSITIDNSTLAVVGGGTEATAMRVTIANDSTGLVSVDDGGSSLTVDGTVAATQSGVWNITTLTGITNDVNIADGGNSITVDAVNLDIRDLTSASDSVEVLQDTHDDLNLNANIQISDTDVSAANPVPVTIVDPGASTTEVNDYDTQASLAGAASDNHDYAVTSAKFLLRSVIASASGSMKIEVQIGPSASLVSKAVSFIPKAGGTVQLDFNPPMEILVASSGTVRVIRTNREGNSQDVYSTIIGNDVA